jgi:hypothetical protein
MTQERRNRPQEQVDILDPYFDVENPATPAHKKAALDRRNGNLTDSQRFNLFYMFLIEKALGSQESFSLQNPFITNALTSLHASLLLDQEYAQKGGVIFEGQDRLIASMPGQTYGDIDFSDFNYNNFSSGRGGSYAKIAPLIPSGRIGNVKLDGSAEQAIRIVLTKEGGFSNHAADTGGATIYGIASEHNPVEYRRIMDALRRGDSAEAKSIVYDTYKRKYWDRLNLDNLNLSPEAKLVAFDASVNQGPEYARQLIGRTNGDVDAMLQERMNRYYAIVDRNSSQAVFLRGWTNRIAGISGIVEGSQRLRGQEGSILASANISTRDVMAIGDSHAVGMDGNNDLNRNGLTLAGFRQLIRSNIDTLPQGRPILASIGSNDVMNNPNAEAYAREYISLLGELKKNGNNVTVVGIPALDRSYNGHDPAVWNVRATRLNDAIEREARRNGMGYVDMDGPSSDGLHRTRDGYRATVQNAVYTTIKKPDLDNDNPVRVASASRRVDDDGVRAASVRESGFVDRVADAGRSVLKRFASLDLNPFS